MLLDVNHEFIIRNFSRVYSGILLKYPYSMSKSNEPIFSEENHRVYSKQRDTYQRRITLYFYAHNNTSLLLFDI